MAVCRLAKHAMPVLQRRRDKEERCHVLTGGIGRSRLDPSAGTRPSRMRDVLPAMDRRGASEPEVIRQPELLECPRYPASQLGQILRREPD